MAVKFILDGIAVYASVHTANKTAEAFTLDLVVQDEAQLKKATDVGLSPAEDKSGNLISHKDLGIEGPVFRMKKRAFDKRSNPLPKPLVADSQGTPITNLIGNGSKVRVHGSVYNWLFKGKVGASGNLDGVQVLDLVEFERVKFGKVEGGFVASTDSSPELPSTDSDDASSVI